jgi:hypothetical protein
MILPIIFNVSAAWAINLFLQGTFQQKEERR